MSSLKLHGKTLSENHLAKPLQDSWPLENMKINAYHFRPPNFRVFVTEQQITNIPLVEGIFYTEENSHIFIIEINNLIK